MCSSHSLATAEPPRQAPLLVPAPEAQRLLGGISRRGLFDLVKKKSLPSVRLGNKVMFRPADLEAWIALQQQAAKPGLRIHQATTPETPTAPND